MIKTDSFFNKNFYLKSLLLQEIGDFDRNIYQKDKGR